MFLYLYCYNELHQNTKIRRDTKVENKTIGINFDSEIDHFRYALLIKSLYKNLSSRERKLEKYFLK